ncbi:uncharacterized protein [Drosophila takahashii]|uniref:uncharacterized protein isoform X6 n=1 Tax=Drosophila takahashii TaxID=29030 RepID=UPI003898FE52
MENAPSLITHLPLGRGLNPTPAASVLRGTRRWILWALITNDLQKCGFYDPHSTPNCTRNGNSSRSRGCGNQRKENWLAAC